MEKINKLILNKNNLNDKNNNTKNIISQRKKLANLYVLFQIYLYFHIYINRLKKNIIKKLIN